MANDITPITDIPENAPKPEDPPEFIDGDNLAGDEKLVEWVRKRFEIFYRKYSEMNDTKWDEVWNPADEMYRTMENDSARESAQTDNTKASTGTSLYFRQVRTLATGIISIILAQKMPFRFVPIASRSAFYKSEEGQQLAEQHNLLMKYTMRQDGFELKIMNMAWQLIKYGNLPVQVTFKREKKKIKDRVVAKRDADGKPTKFKFEEKEVYTANWPSLESIANENFFVDHTGGNLQRKPAAITRGFDTLNGLYSMARSGEYTNIDKINKTHLYIGVDPTDAQNDKHDNMNVEFDQLIDTGEFEVFNAYIKIPLSDKGKIDPKNAEPVWYLTTWVGSPDTGQVCVRIIKNPDPDGELPFNMLHALPDDDDILYHMGYSQASQSTYNEMLTSKNQAIDQKNVLINRPLKAVVGEVHNDDLEFAQNKIFHVDTPNSISDFQTQNVFPDTVALWEKLEEDMNKTMATDKPIVGEALGGRTSATEAQNIFEQALKPALVLVKYVLTQFLPWYAQKSLRLWHLYAHPDQIAEITGEEEIIEIKPAELYGEFDVEMDMIDEFVENGQVVQNMQYLVSQILASPEAAGVIDFKELLREILTRLKITKNPARLLKPDKAWDAEMVAELENKEMMDPEDPEFVEPQPNQDHVVHLRRHKSERQQYTFLPKEQQPLESLAMLDMHIQLHEDFKEQSNAQQAAPPEAPPTPGLPGELSGDQIAGDSAGPGRPSIADQEQAAELEQA